MLSQYRRLYLGPVIGAGLSFISLGAILAFSASAFSSSALAGLGYELLFDGSYYLLGGLLSQLLTQSKTHFWNCWSRETLELIALLAGTIVFAIGAIRQPSAQTSLGQMAAGLVFAPIAVPMNWYWHHKLQPLSGKHHHNGFDTHMKIDAATAILVAMAGVVAFATGNPQWNKIFAAVVVAIAIGWSAKPAYRITIRMAHHPRNHV